MSVTSEPHQQLLQEDPQPAPAARLDVSLKPAPRSDSMKSTLIGLTSSKRPLSTRKVTPLSVKISSFPCDSSRAIPSEGPPHPACMSIRMEGASVRLFRNSLIISLAFSVTSNILPPSSAVLPVALRPLMLNKLCTSAYFVNAYFLPPLSNMLHKSRPLCSILFSVPHPRRRVQRSAAPFQASFRSPKAISCKPVRSKMDMRLPCNRIKPCRPMRAIIRERVSGIVPSMAANCPLGISRLISSAF